MGASVQMQLSKTKSRILINFLKRVQGGEISTRCSKVYRKTEGLDRQFKNMTIYNFAVEQKLISDNQNGKVTLKENGLNFLNQNK